MSSWRNVTVRYCSGIGCSDAPVPRGSQSQCRHSLVQLLIMLLKIGRQSHSVSLTPSRCPPSLICADQYCDFGYLPCKWRESYCVSYAALPGDAQLSAVIAGNRWSYGASQTARASLPSPASRYRANWLTPGTLIS